MNKQQEALKLALEALEEINKLSIGENAICLPAEIDTAMDAIREALAEQPASKPLTDEEIKRMAAPLFMSHYWNLCNKFARAIEAAHGIKEDA